MRIAGRGSQSACCVFQRCGRVHAALPRLRESGSTVRRVVASAAIRAEAPPSCDRMPTLTVEFHSVSTGPRLGCPHPNQRPRSILAPLLTNGIHSVWRRRGSSDSHPNRRTRLIVCRHSPSKFPVLRVVAERAVHTRIDTLVRARAVTHHRNSQCFESSRSGLSTRESAPLFGCCRCSPSKFTAFGVVAERAVHTRIGILIRARAITHRRNSQGSECPRAAISTPGLAPRSTAQPHAPKPDGHVDILQPNRLTTLCIRKVRTNVPAAREGCGGVDISCRHRIVALWISTVSVGIRLSCGPIEVWTSGTRRDSKPCAIER